MKPRRIDKFAAAPPGMKKVHIEYYMAYPKVAPPTKKAAPSKKNVTVRKKKAAAAVGSYKFKVMPTGKKITF